MPEGFSNAWLIPKLRHRLSFMATRVRKDLITTFSEDRTSGPVRDRGGNGSKPCDGRGADYRRGRPVRRCCFQRRQSGHNPVTKGPASTGAAGFAGRADSTTSETANQNAAAPWPYSSMPNHNSQAAGDVALSGRPAI